MYGHITTINKVRHMSTGTALADKAPALKARPGAGAGDDDRPRPKGSNIHRVVQGSSRKVLKSVDNARMGEDVHFNKRKGVVNTFGGSKDTTRKPKSASSGDMRSSDRLRSSGVHTISSMSAGGGGGAGARAPRGGSAGKGGIHTFQSLEHDSKVGLRKGDGTGGGGGAAVSSAPSSGVGDLGSIRVSAPSKKSKAKAAARSKAQAATASSGGRVGAGASSAGSARPPAAAKPSGGAAERGPPIVRKLGRAGGGVAASAQTDREKRLAFFDKKFGK